MGTNPSNLNDLTRVVIYTKDIERLTGRTERYARKIMRCMRRHYGKEKKQLVSVSELAAFLGLPLQEVIGQLRLKRG